MSDFAKSAEQVRAGHPDKLCDQIADAILDRCLQLAKRHLANDALAEQQRTGLEVLAKDSTIVLSGEIRLADEIVRTINLEQVVHDVFGQLKYPTEGLRVIDIVGIQQPELQASSDRRGAGDQGIMVGHATRETHRMMPLEHVLATDICRALDDKMADPDFGWIRPDGKAQVTLGPDKQIRSAIVGVQHTEEVEGAEDPILVQRIIKERVLESVLIPILGPKVLQARIVVNGTGSFAIGGPAGDAGVVGRKIVCDSYGPHIPVGGGAFSGKDPTKVDRSAAYMARYIALQALHQHDEVNEVLVHLSYAIGERQPEMIVVHDSQGRDLSDWARDCFPDLSPMGIQQRFDLWRHGESTWTYAETARYGHFGDKSVPWESLDDEVGNVRANTT